MLPKQEHKPPSPGKFPIIRVIAPVGDTPEAEPTDGYV